MNRDRILGNILSAAMFGVVGLAFVGVIVDAFTPDKPKLYRYDDDDILGIIHDVDGDGRLNEAEVESYKADYDNDESYADLHPAKLDETRSDAFTQDHLDRANSADDLVLIYCDGIESDAQRLGCASHVTVEEVCRRDTAARTWSVGEYSDRYGEDPCAG